MMKRYLVLIVFLSTLMIGCSNPMHPFLGVWKNTHKEFKRATMIEFTIEEDENVITLWESGRPYKYSCDLYPQEDEYVLFGCGWKRKRFSEHFTATFKISGDTLFPRESSSPYFNYPLGGPFMQIDSTQKEILIQKDLNDF